MIKNETIENDTLFIDNFMINNIFSKSYFSFFVPYISLLLDCTTFTLTLWYAPAFNLWEQHENATSYFDQILEAAPHEATAVRLLTFHLTSHPNQTNKTCGTLQEKQVWREID